MTTGDVHVGDVGTHYRAKIQDAGATFDPSRATVVKLLWKPPRAPQFDRPATLTTDGVDWFLNYALVEGIDDAFHSRPGLWRWQGFVEFPDGQRYHTGVDTYVVAANLETVDAARALVVGPALLSAAPYGYSFAAANQGLAVSLWYDRPLQRIGLEALTLTVQSSNPQQMADQILPFSAAYSHLITDQPAGKANVLFLLAPLDLTAAAGLTFACTEASRRVGWAQLTDLEARPIADSLRPFTVTIPVLPNDIIGPGGWAARQGARP